MELPELKIYDMPRAAHVTRWHAVNSIKKPSVAAHSWLVNRYAVHLAKKIIGDSLTIEKLFAMSEYALVHDCVEILTGDVSSRLKKYISLVSDGISPITTVEDKIAPWIKTMKDELQDKAPELLLIVKLADLIDALVFITVEGIGPHARDVEKRLDKMLKDKFVEAVETYPQYNWHEATHFVTKLIESEGMAQIAFEAGTNGDREKECDEKFIRLFGEVNWTSS